MQFVNTGFASLLWFIYEEHEAGVSEEECRGWAWRRVQVFMDASCSPPGERGPTPRAGGWSRTWPSWQSPSPEDDMSRISGITCTRTSLITAELKSPVTQLHYSAFKIIITVSLLFPWQVILLISGNKFLNNKNLNLSLNFSSIGFSSSWETVKLELNLWKMKLKQNCIVGKLYNICFITCLSVSQSNVCALLTFTIIRKNNSKLTCSCASFKPLMFILSQDFLHKFSVNA